MHKILELPIPRPRLEQLFTVKQVSQTLCCHPISIYKASLGLIAMPIPPFVRMGRSIRFRERDVTAFINEMQCNSVHQSKPVAPTAKPKRGRPRKVSARQQVGSGVAA